MSRPLLQCILVLVLGALGTTAQAQAQARASERVERAGEERVHALGVFPLVRFFTTALDGEQTSLGLGVVEEIYLARTHGLLVDLRGVWSWHDRASWLDVRASLGYRWSWSKQGDTGFYDLHVGGLYRRAETLHVAPMIACSIGYRWVWSPGFSIVLRMGPGYARAVTGPRPARDPLTGFMVDSELSFGWSW